MTGFQELLLDNESTVRLTSFLGMFVVMAAWEILSPRRRYRVPRLLRWTNNLGLVIVDTLLLRLVFPVLAIGVAVNAEVNGWGLLNLIDIPAIVAVIVALLLLDLAIYGQHVATHKIPFLWRLHRVHHADLDFDLTTGLRFHPVEILLSMGFKMLVVLALGAPAVAVLIFEVVLNVSAVFNHGNVSLPAAVDRWLRWIIVTPDMHRVHHSIHRIETDSNYGFSLSWWDRLFGTYTSQPTDGHDRMTIGIEQFRTRRDLWLDRLLLQPLRPREPATPELDGEALSNIDYR